MFVGRLWNWLLKKISSGVRIHFKFFWFYFFDPATFFWNILYIYTCDTYNLWYSFIRVDSSSVRCSTWKGVVNINMYFMNAWIVLNHYSFDYHIFGRSYILTVYNIIYKCVNICRKYCASSVDRNMWTYSCQATITVRCHIFQYS